MKGAVEAIDAAAKTITIAGTQYTAAETVTLDGIAMGDSVNYSVDGTTVTSLDRFYTAAPMDAPMTDSLGMGLDSLGNAIGTGLDSAAAEKLACKLSDGRRHRRTVRTQTACPVVHARRG